MLFDLPDEPDPKSRPDEPQAPLVGTPRFQAAVRDQVGFRAASLDELIPHEHPVRVIWDYALLGRPLPPLSAASRPSSGMPDAPPSTPGSSSPCGSTPPPAAWAAPACSTNSAATKIDYQWIGGDVTVNYHTLADFRRDHAGLLDDLLTRSVAVLMAEGLVDLERVAQDGMRVRASAGAASFRRKPTLEEALAEAQAQVESVAAGTGGRPEGLQRPPEAGAAPRRRGARRAGRGGPGAAARAGGEEEARREGQGAVLDDRPGGHRDEDGRRGLQPGVQHPVRHGHQEPGDRGRGRGDDRQRPGADAADGRPDPASGTARRRASTRSTAGSPSTRTSRR